MKRLLVPLVLALPLLLIPSEGKAADHYDMFESKDAIAGQEERHHDIVDLFTFPSPERPGRLVMIMNTHNRAHTDSVFLDSIHYSFRVRTGPVREKGAEYRFTCTFDAKPTQTATCITYRIENGTATPVKGGSTVFKVGETSDSNPNIRAFAGIRADAFFGDALGLVAMVKTHTIPFGVSSSITPESWRNLTYNTNDLAIVLEVDLKKLLGENGPIFRVAAETAKKKSR